MLIDSINYKEKPKKKIFEWSGQGKKNKRKHFDAVLAAVIDGMRKWGYLTDVDTPCRICRANYYNRAEFLINVLPNLKKLFQIFFKS